MDKMIGRRMIPHYSTPEACYLSQNNLILKYCYDTEKFERVCSVGRNSGGILVILKEKLLRNSIYRTYISNNFGLNHVCVAPNSHLISIYDGLYRFDLTSAFAPAERVDDYDRLGFVSPLKSGIALDESTGDFYFGEYVNGTKRPIRICRVSNQGREVEIVYEFPLGRIQHIHGIFFDRCRHRLWITTGDRDHECAIFYTDDFFSTLNELGGGDQSWRAVSVIPTEQKLFWGMDAGKDAPENAINKVYCFDLDSGTREIVGEIGNPAYHAVQSKNGDMYLGVNFEPGRRQDTPEESAIWSCKLMKLNSSGAEQNESVLSLVRSFPFCAGKVT